MHLHARGPQFPKPKPANEKPNLLFLLRDTAGYILYPAGSKQLKGGGIRERSTSVIVH